MWVWSVLVKMALEFSDDGKYFAQISSDGKLKIWNTVSNSLDQEFTPDFHLTTPCTCLHFWYPRQGNNTKVFLTWFYVNISFDNSLEASLYKALISEPLICVFENKTCTRVLWHCWMDILQIGLAIWQGLLL